MLRKRREVRTKDADDAEEADGVEQVSEVMETESDKNSMPAEVERARELRQVAGFLAGWHGKEKEMQQLG